MPLWEPTTDSTKCLEEEFAIDVFDEKNQRKFLGPAAFKAFSTLIKNNEQTMIDPDLANQVASAMKAWAVSRGGTHWTHWFQPMTVGGMSATADKHDTFMGRSDADGHPLLDLTGQELVRMEPDASSFPNGGLRNTHTARGYTIWDPLSPAFLMHYKHGATLFIPCAFVSWTKEALDHKTPLMKAEEALSYQAVKMLNAIGDNSVRVSSTLGCEQEYFILDRVKFLARPDLLCSGRTLQGAAPPKGQELDDHYFNSIPRKIVACMQDMEMQCWRLGIPVTTRHNEVCPAQHEFAPVFEYTSVAVDHQNLLMTVMKEKAREHGFECLLHEKPFAGLNGTGKHNNWSIATNQGTNLLNPPKDVLDDPARAFDGLTNLRFTSFLAATIKAVDDHSGSLRCSVANAGQDLRLGANEAPPAIISVYLGDALQNVVDAIVKDDKTPALSPRSLKAKAAALTVEQSSRLPLYQRDRTDRNRTSPFAFTGNKFEFRAVGGTQNVAVPMTTLNAAVAAALDDMYAAMKAKGNANDPRAALKEVVIDVLKKHHRIMFNGDGYSAEWVTEAAKRGLPNYNTTPKALLAVDSVPLFTRHKVMTKPEVEARKEVALENYAKQKQIEFKSMVMMASQYFVPAGQMAVARMGAAQAYVKVPETEKTIGTIGALLSTILKEQATLKELMGREHADVGAEATLMDTAGNESMARMRAAADELEMLCTKAEWKLPSYLELLYMQCDPSPF